MKQPAPKFTQGVVADSPEVIKFFRLAALKNALALECKGLRRSRPPSAYVVLKKEYGFKGGKQKVLQQAQNLVDKLIAER